MGRGVGPLDGHDGCYQGQGSLQVWTGYESGVGSGQSHVHVLAIADLKFLLNLSYCIVTSPSPDGPLDHLPLQRPQHPLHGGHLWPHDALSVPHPGAGLWAQHRERIPLKQSHCTPPPGSPSTPLPCPLSHHSLLTYLLPGQVVNPLVKSWTPTFSAPLARTLSSRRRSLSANRSMTATTATTGSTMSEHTP